MKPLARGLGFVAILVLGFGPPALSQAPPTPTLGPPGPCPAVARFDFDVSSIDGADRTRWQIWRAAPGQSFGAATQVDVGTEPTTTGSVQRDLRAYGRVLDGTRYFFRVRARQGSTNISPFSQPVIFELDVSPDGLFTAAAGSPGTLRVDWNLTGPIGGCADRVAIRVEKADGSASLQSVEAGASGTRTYDLTAQGAGDYDVRLHARFGGDEPQDAVGRESAPVRRGVPSLPALAIDDATFPEGNAGNAQNVVVRLSAPASQPVSVLIGARPGGTATEGTCTTGRDFTFAFRTVTLSAGQTQIAVPFTLCGDNVQEPDESFALGLTGAVNATLGDSIAQVTIRNDDGPAPVTVSVYDATFLEGNASSAQVVAVRLSASTTQPVTVLVGARPGGTATEGSCGAGRDATFAFRSVTIEPGRTGVDVPLTLCGDVVFEPDETLSVGLTGAVNAALGDSTGLVTIRNDDPEPITISSFQLQGGALSVPVAAPVTLDATMTGPTPTQYKAAVCGTEFSAAAFQAFPATPPPRLPGFRTVGTRIVCYQVGVEGTLISSAVVRDTIQVTEPLALDPGADVRAAADPVSITSFQIKGGAVFAGPYGDVPLDITFTGDPTEFRRARAATPSECTSVLRDFPFRPFSPSTPLTVNFGPVSFDYEVVQVVCIQLRGGGRTSATAYDDIGVVGEAYAGPGYPVLGNADPAAGIGVRCDGLAVGIVAQAGELVDALGLLCADPGPNGEHRSITETALVGGGGGKKVTVPCPSGQVLGGLEARWGLVIDRVTIRCIGWRSNIGAGGDLQNFGSAGGPKGDRAGSLGCEIPRGVRRLIVVRDLRYVGAVVVFCDVPYGF